MAFDLGHLPGGALLQECRSWEVTAVLRANALTVGYGGMEISSDQILEIISNCIRPEDIKRSCIYWYKKTLAQGAEVRIGPQTIAMPFDGMLVFVDLAPRANWAHPCLYMLVETRTLDTKIIEASFPPSIDPSDESYIILLRFGHKPPHARYFNVFDK